MKTVSILWVDDEIELLKPHILFLTERGYEVSTCTNGTDALNLIRDQEFDIILLDEHMPGLSGLETLNQIKILKPPVPVVMITKSEEENLMEDAIGSKIADYLIKPVNPKQILLSVKKNTEQKKLVSEKTTSAYQTEFMQISRLISDAGNFEDWSDLYQKLVFWELELSRIQDQGMTGILQSQRVEANASFSRFIRRRYEDWITGKTEKPVLSHTLFKEKIMPLLSDPSIPVFVIVIDNLRLDHWKTIYPLLSDFLKLETDTLYCSILPTVTQYARNALFAGLMPLSIRKIYPGLWEGNDEDEMNNRFEEELLHSQLNRLGLQLKTGYEKISNQRTGRKLVENIHQYLDLQLAVFVYNFVDILSHARTDLDTIRELADDEAAYRTLTRSWFEHSYLFDLLKILSEYRCKIVITTDHGSVKVNRPIKVVGDKTSTVNLRYKQGKALNYNPKEVFEVPDPELFQLPKFNVSTKFIFASNDDFMAYPNNYNHYANYYRNTFQHGGISLEEMLVPFAVLVPNRI